jgi:hypothetical protein
MWSLIRILRILFGHNSSAFKCIQLKSKQTRTFLAIVLTLLANIVVVVVIVVVNVVVGKHNDGNKQYDMIL